GADLYDRARHVQRAYPGAVSECGRVGRRRFWGRGCCTPLLQDKRRQSGGLTVCPSGSDAAQSALLRQTPQHQSPEFTYGYSDAPYATGCRSLTPGEAFSPGPSTQNIPGRLSDCGKLSRFRVSPRSTYISCVP